MMLVIFDMEKQGDKQDDSDVEFNKKQSNFDYDCYFVFILSVQIVQW